MTILKNFAPGPAFRDLRTFLRTRKRHQIWMLIPSLLVVIAILFGFIKDSRFFPEYKANITYFQSWPLDRSDEEIRAQMAIDKVRNDKARAELEKKQKARRQEFQQIDNSLKGWGLHPDSRWMAAALALSERTRGRTAPNPNVGCVIVKQGRVLGRGWTRPGGRPHAEAVALAQAGDAARGATVYTTLEPCAHESARGPACSDLLVTSGVARVVIALGDPDARTNGQGAARLRAAGIEVVEGVAEAGARAAMAGFLTRQAKGRPFVTLKLATSLDGRIAMASGESHWITGPEARAHAHVERGRHEAILVGRGTFEADSPKLDVRLPGLEARAPRRLLLTRHPGESPGWEGLNAPGNIATLEGVDHVLVEGGAGAASAFLRAGLVDRLLLYRAPILIGAGRDALGDIGLGALAEAHGRWTLTDARQLGSDRLEVYAAR